MDESNLDRNQEPTKGMANKTNMKTSTNLNLSQLQSHSRLLPTVAVAKVYFVCVHY